MWNGSLKRISWSRTGVLAYIVSDDVPRVCLSCMVCVDGESWSLSKPVEIPDLAVIHGAYPIVHISWSPVGSDLVCIDTSGKLSVHSYISMLAPVTCVYRSIVEQGDDLEQVAGFSWLTSDKPIYMGSSATKGSPLFNYAIQQTKPFGPSHPTNVQQACLAVTRSGKLKLWYQVDSKYREVSKDLAPMARDPDCLFSRACLGQLSWDGSLIICCYLPYTHQIQVYRSIIRWNVTTGDDRNAQMTPASIEVSRLLTQDFYFDFPGAHFSDLQIISSNYPHSLPILLSVFTTDKTTRIVRHTFSQYQPAVHSVFDKFSQSSSLPTENDILFQHKDTMPIIPHVLTSIQAMPYERLVCLTYASGYVELRTRNSFMPCQTAHDPDVITTMFDAGFGLPKLPESRDICISPNLVAFVCVNPQGDLNLHGMVKTMSSADDSTVAATAIALRHSIACFKNSFSDDIIYMVSQALPSLPPHCLQRIFLECHRGLSFSVDLPPSYQVDKLMVNPALQRLISLQATLGTGKNWSRNVSGRIAWTILSLRLFGFALTFTLRTGQLQQRQSRFNENELRAAHVWHIMGLIRYVIDLVVYITQELCMHSQDPEYYVQKETASIAMAILLGAIPRAFLLYAVRGIRGLDRMIERSAERETDKAHGPATQARQQLKDVMESSVVPLPLFEQFTNDIDSVLKPIPRSTTETLPVEQALIFEGAVSRRLLSTVNRLCQVFVQRMKPAFYEPDVYFYDTVWIGVLPPGPRYAESRCRVDGLRKQLLPSKLRENELRQCSRCGTISTIEDFNLKSLGSSAPPANNHAGGNNPHDTKLQSWTMAFQKMCACGSPWIAYLPKQRKISAGYV